MHRTIDAALPSYYFAPYVTVLITECGHRHVRATEMGHKPGDALDCPFCEDPAVPYQPPDIGTDGPDIGTDVPGGGAI